VADGKPTPKKRAKRSAAKSAKKTAPRRAAGRKKPAARKRAPSGRDLVIVESPAKARTIGRVLGGEYEVRASMGHVRDLPRKELGVDVENDFAPTYVTLPGKKVPELRKLAKRAGRVYLATDPDREGEAIAWHLAEALELDAERTWRVTFHEITPEAVRAAFEKPGRIDPAKVDAQQARRILDRLVGYRLSPLLWKKIAKGLSAGRVQSVAVRLAVEREAERRAFTIEEFWRVTARLTAESGPIFPAEFKSVGGLDAKIPNEAEATALVNDLAGAAWHVHAIHEREVRSRPSPPFTTSSLQQSASTRLGLSPRRTMRLAQQLYEGVDLGAAGIVGLITYMRTDSFNVAESALESVRALVAGSFGEKYLPEKPRRYRARKNAQEAHEAIRPTDVARTPDAMASHLAPDQLKLYRLIWERFVASQMSDARFRATAAEIDATPTAGRVHRFRAKGRVVLFDGHTRVGGLPARKKRESEGKDKDAAEADAILPPLAEGAALACRELVPSQHFTKPPARFTEASLIRELEKDGIGRPSTYATIIQTIQERGYVARDGRMLVPSPLGELVTKKLTGHFPTVMDVAFTRKMEEDLDHIEEGAMPHIDVLRGFYEPFERNLAEAQEKMPSEKGAKAEIGEACPECGEPLLMRWSRGGQFIGCSGFPKCRYARSLDGTVRAKPVETEHVCDLCGKMLLLRTGKRGRFLACSGFPKCRRTMDADADGNPLKPPPGMETCEKCGSPMVVKRSRRGRFVACSAYPKCRNSKNFPEAGAASAPTDGSAPAAPAEPAKPDAPDDAAKGS